MLVDRHRGQARDFHERLATAVRRNRRQRPFIDTTAKRMIKLDSRELPVRQSMLRAQRRYFLTAAGALAAASLTAKAQAPTKIPRIGYIHPGTADPGSGTVSLFEAFRQGLGDLGYVEGRNVLIEFRIALGQPERLPALAAELVALKVDVIVTGGGTLVAQAAQHASGTLPIVAVSVGDPVTSGLVSSLARPGGNVTGL